MYPQETLTSWVPTDMGGGAVPLGINAANYFQQGRLVYFQFDISYPINIDTINQVKISLPVPGIPQDQPVSVGYNLGSKLFYANVTPATCVKLFAAPNTIAALKNADLSDTRFSVAGVYISSE